MANEIKDKYSLPRTALTITLASLASSTARVGRQSDVVDNTTTRFDKLLIYFKIKQGTSPTGLKAIYFDLIRDDGSGTPVRTDGAGATDAAFTAITADLIYTAPNKAAPATGDVIQGSFVIDKPGPKWALSISHDTVVALDATGGNHEIYYVGVNPEVQ